MEAFLSELLNFIQLYKILHKKKYILIVIFAMYQNYPLALNYPLWQKLTFQSLQ